MLLRQIQHFQAIVEEKSFTKAAERCYISQSGISQSIKSLEKEVCAQLLVRKNRSFELTEAGEHFYRKSLVITADLDQLCRETQRIAHKDAAELSLGVLATYSGNEYNTAIAKFAEQYPTVDLKVTTGNHEDLYAGLLSGKLDLVLNNQRRAFSDVYKNLVLKETICYVELAAFNPLSKLDFVSVDDLKNTPCILVASPKQQEVESRFYHDVIGFHGEFLFAENLQEARVLLVTNRGVMPIESSDKEVRFNGSTKRLALMHGKEPVKRTYCAFWRKDNSGYYVEEFAEILKSMF